MDAEFNCGRGGLFPENTSDGASLDLTKSPKYDERNNAVSNNAENTNTNEVYANVEATNAETTDAIGASATEDNANVHGVFTNSETTNTNGISTNANGVFTNADEGKCTDSESLDETLDYSRNSQSVRPGDWTVMPVSSSRSIIPAAVHRRYINSTRSRNFGQQTSRANRRSTIMYQRHERSTRISRSVILRSLERYLQSLISRPESMYGDTPQLNYPFQFDRDQMNPPYINQHLNCTDSTLDEVRIECTLDPNYLGNANGVPTIAETTNTNGVFTNANDGKSTESKSLNETLDNSRNSQNFHPMNWTMIPSSVSSRRSIIPVALPRRYRNLMRSRNLGQNSSRANRRSTNIYQSHERATRNSRCMEPNSLERLVQSLLSRSECMYVDPGSFTPQLNYPIQFSRDPLNSPDINRHLNYTGSTLDQDYMESTLNPNYLATVNRVSTNDETTNAINYPIQFNGVTVNTPYIYPPLSYTGSELHQNYIESTLDPNYLVNAYMMSLLHYTFCPI